MCPWCLAKAPAHAGVRAAVAYGDVARTLALRLKYGGRTGDAAVVGGLMARHVPGNAALLIPVPLHRWRLWRRGYNQAGLIAVAIGEAAGIPVAHSVLERRRATPILRDRSPAQRRKAVQGAFHVRPEARAHLQDRRLVLVDDVYTSGATTDACTATLLRAGAASVTILAWARVLGDWEGGGIGD